MRKALRYSLFLSVLLALTFPLTSCDSGGSNSSPDWVGNWELTSTVNGNPPANPIFYNIDEEEFTSVLKGSSGCVVVNDDVVELDGNVMTISTEQGLEKLSLDASDGTLTITILESDDPNVSDGDEVTAQSIDENARDAANCS